MSVLKTVQPSWTDLTGHAVQTAGRHGKFLDLVLGPDQPEHQLHLIVHLARAGWLRWSETLSAAPPRPGKGPLALRVYLGPPGEGPGFDLTEAGTKKGLAAWVVTDPADVPGIARLGPDALSIT